MPERHLIDTDVLIDYLRGNSRAVAFMDGLDGDILVSAVSVAELYAGVRPEEERALEQFLLAFEIVPIDQAVAVRGGLYRRGFSGSHGVGLADALIAAAAETAGASLVSLNRRHFPMIERVTVPYRRG